MPQGLPLSIAAILAGLTALRITSSKRLRQIWLTFLVRIGIASRVELHGPGDEKLKRLIVDACPHLSGPLAVYAPTFFLRNGHAHVRIIQQPDALTYHL